MLVNALRETAKVALDLVFPARCVNCRAEGTLLCANCLDDAVRLDGPACSRCAAPMKSGSLCQKCAASPRQTGVDRLIAAYKYDGAIREAIHALKYEGLRAVAPQLGGLMAQLPALGGMKLDLAIPVPVHPSRLRSRGYNQSDLLAKEVAARLSLPLDARSLRRVRNSPPQARTPDEQQRARQVEGAFEAMPDRVTGRRALLVDDVATTCSTLNACAGALKAAGAGWVAALVLAREV
ncbi:MAG: ComF family protein [Dehalococcoidia bacterium]|nr:ComF family protein [Dehalococcoidia bacterium]MSQ35385.1 ComF family protein [Dehalococcoidia bacterium]